MNKFEFRERLLQEINKESSFLPDEHFTEEEYQLFKALFEQNLSLTVFLFKDSQQRKD